MFYTHATVYTLYIMLFKGGRGNTYSDRKLLSPGFVTSDLKKKNGQTDSSKASL